MHRIIRAIIILILVAATFAVGIFVWAFWAPTTDQVLAELPTSPWRSYIDSLKNQTASMPILVVVDRRSDNSFISYVTEILRAEGISSFHIIDHTIDTVSLSFLSSHRLIIASGLDPRSLLVDALKAFVKTGGRAIFLDPPETVDSLLGVHSDGRFIENGYVRFDRASHITRGLVNTPLQFHGRARTLQPTTATSIATLLETRDGDQSFAAAGINKWGKGRTAFIAYDLGRSIVFTRQGRPDTTEPRRSVDRDEDGVTRTADLYFESYDSTNCYIPQGDQQQRLFVRLIDELLGEEYVLPRSWYFPDSARSVAVVTGDAHNTSPSAIDSMVTNLERASGEFSLIEYPTALSDSTVQALRLRGHTVSPHPYYPRPDNKFPLRVRLKIANFFSPTYFYKPRFVDLRDEVAFAVNHFQHNTGLPTLVTRMHFLTWWGWSETASLLSAYGVRMDLSITGLNPHLDFRLPIGDGSLKSPAGFGYINGSGRPMHFVDRAGRFINIYSQLTIVEDDVISGAYLTTPQNDSLAVSRIAGTCQRLIDESVDRFHTALVFNFHPEHAVIPFPPNAPLTWPWVTATIDHLKRRGVPMISAEHWLHFVEARDALTIRDVMFDHKTRRGSCVIDSPLPIQNATILIPLTSILPHPGITAHTVGSRAPLAVRSRVTTIDSENFLEVTLDLDEKASTLLSYTW